MSKEELEITRENATEDNLSKLHYGSLKETFEKLGLKNVWKPGGKKVSMIKEALSKLSLMKSGEVQEVEAEVILEEEEKERGIVIKKEEDLLIESIEKQGFSKDELAKKIKQLQRAVGSCIATHKPGLVKRLVAHEKLYASKYE